MQVWENFLKTQEKELGKETVKKWLLPLRIIRYDAGNLYLEAKDSFQIIWFEEHIRKKVQSQLINNNNRPIKVHLTIEDEIVQKPKGHQKSEGIKEKPEETFELTFDELDPNCTFKNFIVTEGNLLTHKLLCKIANWDPVSEKVIPSSGDLAAFNPIYLYGPEGTGKTHLMHATAHALKELGYRVIYIRAETFTEHVVKAIRSSEMSIFRQAYRNIDVLLIDNVHVFSRKGATQEELFHTFNTLHMAGKQIILSAGSSPAELQLIEPRLVSRFEWGIVLNLENYSAADISLILKKKAKSLDFELSDNIAEFLLEKFTSSSKALLQAIEALILRMHLEKSSGKLVQKTLTVSLVQHMISDLLVKEEESAVTPDRIVSTVADTFGILPEDLLGKGQSREHVLPRQIAMHLCRSRLKLPYTKIGELFSRDHSTVMTSVKAIQASINSDVSEITSPITKIQKKLRQL